MNLIRYTDSGFPGKLNKLIAASSLFDPLIEQRTRQIVHKVEQHGDKALLSLTEKYDGARLTPCQLSVDPAERTQAPRPRDARPRAGERRAAGAHAAVQARRQAAEA